MVDLHPAGFDDSYAYGVSDGQQVGWGWSSGPVSSMHALLWSGTAESYVDLNPSGFESSCAYGVSGGQQVGEGWSSAPGSSSHALLWSGTAGSCVDLNPSGFYSSHAHGISGGQQVGAGDFSATDYHGHALLWSGTPESYVDLHSFLPAGYVSSEAYGIDSSGKIVGWARMADGYTKHAVMWVREFMITFDDGPGSVSTPYILDQLKNIKKADGNSVKAGFFLVGENKSRATCYDIWKCDFWRCVPWWPDDRCPDPGVISNLGIVQRIANEGHFIGIHTQHHPDLENLTPEDVNSEIIDCYNAIQVAGVAPMKVFRSPYLHDPENIPPSLQDWKKIRGNLTGDPSPFISEQSVINNCKEIMEQATKFPVTLIFHDFRGLPSHRFNFENIVNELKKDYELVDFDPDIASQEVNAIATNTPSGDNVLVILPTNNYVQFSNVTDAGETDTTIVEDSPPLPSNYVLLGAYYDVITTAAYNGPVTVTFAYDVDSQKWVRLLHYEDGQWVDITNPDQPDIFNGIISGTVDNLSLFAVVYLSADLNRDGKVDFADFSLFANNWLEADCEESNNWCEGTDFDHIGSVDMLDLAAFARYWIEGI
jgi:peptidoglycan/xylan/chitin deacetylase (PgdA/CDA1 family)